MLLQAYLAKVYLYKAYRQDEKHNVTSIDTDDLDQVLIYTAAVIGSSYDLAPDFAHNFLPGKNIYENGIGSFSYSVFKRMMAQVKAG